jgi:hypothetical protein
MVQWYQIDEGGNKMNELNKQMRGIVERYTTKNGLQIVDAECYKYAYIVKLADGRQINCNITENQTQNRRRDHLIYMKIEENGKQKRIPKSEW